MGNNPKRFNEIQQKEKLKISSKNSARENGYMLVFDKKKFIDNLKIHLTGGNERTERRIFPNATVIYDDAMQKDIIAREINNLLKRSDLGYFTYGERVELILEKLMYIGNFYKRADRFEDENEYRILLNTYYSNDCSIMKSIEKMLPKHKINNANQKHYVELFFPSDSIIKIVCATEAARAELSSYVQGIPLIVKEN